MLKGFQLNHPIRVLRGMGPKTAEAFEKHGVTTLEDLLYFFPRGWIDATRVIPISELRLGQSGLIDVQVVTVKEGMSQRSRLPYLRALVADASGSVEVMWFHPRFIKQKVKPGARFLLYGRLQGWRAEAAMVVAPRFITKPEILPVYSEINGISSLQIRKLMQQLAPVIDQALDHLPEDVCQEHKLLGLQDTLRAMHFPTSLEDINRAKERLGFDELLMLMLPAVATQQERDKEHVEKINPHRETLDAWVSSLPFPLTGDQRRVSEEIQTDLQSGKPMNRLVQGDVGSGKTAVGLAAALQVALSGQQVAWLAPTELLAQQHFATAQKLLVGAVPELEGLAVGLWTRTSHTVARMGGVSKATLDQVLDCPFIIGTHALLSEKVQFRNLGLLIVDEQHRFGVKQRAQLRRYEGRPVHLLSMTATPIPRTMALLLYGDLQLSLIKEKPQGRRDVVTRVVGAENRDKAYQFVARHIEDGGQVYVICPTIEESKDNEANVLSQLFESVEEKKAVTAWFESLKKVFPTARIGVLHGKLAPREKEMVMEQFRNHALDILVSTTVVEVGVDVPNANIMMIENAECFGLAQLHQLRGRVGRGERQSFCFLFPSSDKQRDNARLQIMEQTNDGFVLAEKDLELRGPGELTGLAQSGLPSLRFASLQDSERIASIKKVAEELVAGSQMQGALERFWRTYHPE